MLRNLPLSEVHPNPDQPRKLFNGDAIAELAASIAASGLIQPITVQRLGDGYQIVAGERRYRAHKLLAETGRLDPPVIRAIVKRPMDECTTLVEAIIENLQREDVSPLEEADAFGRLRDAGMTSAEIAEKVGAAKFRVDWRLSLLGLSDTARSMFAANQIDRQQALEIAKLPTPADQDRIVRLIAQGKITGWASIRDAVQTVINPDPTQTAMFDLSGPTAEEIKTVTGMEDRIDRAAGLVSAGWKDGECVVAAKVDPNRAEKMAEKLKAMRSALAAMERELRNTAAKAAVMSA